MYLRFKTSFSDGYEVNRHGVFQAAHYLLQSEEMYIYDKEWLEDVWAWFRHNLSAPDLFKQQRYDVNVVCWFKPTASEHLQKMYEMKGILELYGYSVTQIKHRKPGYIVYEDDEQVATVPFGKLCRWVR